MNRLAVFFVCKITIFPRYIIHLASKKQKMKP